MPAGSVLVFLGTLWHRGGANRSEAHRLAITAQYCQPWIRQIETMTLAVPPRVARGTRHGYRSSSATASTPRSSATSTGCTHGVSSTRRPKKQHHEQPAVKAHDALAGARTAALLLAQRLHRRPQRSATSLPRRPTGSGLSGRAAAAREAAIDSSR